ncbi:MAG: aldolase/citrate lyase family protein [Chloroflexota bacterium]|nr:aldolase/citrate lyase family protein [Chloroflexota bacterium]
MRGKKLKQKLAAGRPIFTTSIAFYSPRLVELLAATGVDQIFLDAEHGPLSERDCEDMIRAADLFDVPIQIRVPVNEPHVILRYLDIGASNIMVPHATTRADVERAVRAVRYPPEGERGFFFTRGAGRLGLSAAEYMQRANEETLVTALFEDAAGIDDIEAMAQTPGLDGIFVGRFDLASSMGLPGQPWHADVQAVVDRVRDACRKHNMPYGTIAHSREELRTLVEQGNLLIPIGTIELGIEAARAAMAELSEVRRA